MKLPKIIDDNILFILFSISTAFFLWQHSVNFSWDFSSYSLNAQYWLGKSSYFEYYRAPLMPLILTVLGVLGQAVAEYMFIILVSALFYYSSIKLADALRIDRVLFYFISLSPYVILYGLINGSELLSFALLQLFVCAVIERKNYAGIILGLAFLTRFNMSVFIVLLLTRNFRMMVKNAIGFLIPIAAWMAFTFYTTGNALTGIADIYALIFKFQPVVQETNIWHVWGVFLYLLPLFVFGLWIAFNKIASSKNPLIKERKHIVFLAVLLLALYQYFINPIKDVRYIFSLALPAAYFSIVALNELRLTRKQVFSGVMAFLVVVNLLFIGSYIQDSSYEKKIKYEYAIERTNGLGIGYCRTMSNGWVFLNYLGKITEPLPDTRIIQNKLDDGNYMLLFRSIQDPDWVRNYPLVHQFPVVFEDDEIIILGKGICVPPRIVNSTYIERLSDMVMITKNIQINTNPCFTLFNRIELLEKTCNLVNFKGFALDENRYDAARLEGY